jgi:hypothetical protein
MKFIIYALISFVLSVVIMIISNVIFSIALQKGDSGPMWINIVSTLIGLIAGIKIYKLLVRK